MWRVECVILVSMILVVVKSQQLSITAFVNTFLIVNLFSFCKIGYICFIVRPFAINIRWPTLIGGNNSMTHPFSSRTTLLTHLTHFIYGSFNEIKAVLIFSTISPSNYVFVCVYLNQLVTPIWITSFFHFVLQPYDGEYSIALQ